MKRQLAALILLLTVSCSPNHDQTPWSWDGRIFTPVLLRDKDTMNYWNRHDTLRAGEHFKARLFRQFHAIPDSNGVDMIKEFKGYSFRLLMDNDLDPNRQRSWTKMNAYMRQLGDTVFIDIPIDSVIKYADDQISWEAGYGVIFQKDNADTTYWISGTWTLER